jgi:hypothetical protein
MPLSPAPTTPLPAALLPVVTTDGPTYKTPPTQQQAMQQPPEELTLASASLHVPNEDFFKLVQDAGKEWGPTKRKPNKYWAPDNLPHTVGYPDIYACGNKVYKNLCDGGKFSLKSVQRTLLV